MVLAITGNGLVTPQIQCTSETSERTLPPVRDVFTYNLILSQEHNQICNGSAKRPKKNLSSQPRYRNEQ